MNETITWIPVEQQLPQRIGTLSAGREVLLSMKEWPGRAWTGSLDYAWDEVKDDWESEPSWFDSSGNKIRATVVAWAEMPKGPSHGP